MQLIMDRNVVRHNYLFFIYGVITLLKKNDKIQFKVLQQNLAKFENQSLKKIKNGKKTQLKKLLDSKRKEILQYAKDIRKKKYVNSQTLLCDVFDGIPITAKIPTDHDFDVVIEDTPNRLTALVYCPTNNEVYDTLSIQVQAEQVYHKPCTKVKIENMLDDVSKDSTKKTKTATTPATTAAITPATVGPGVIDSDTPIGKVLFSKKYPLILSSQPEKDKVVAGIFERFSETIFPNSYLRLVGDEGKSIFCRVMDIKANPISGAGLEKSFSELSTILMLQPLLEKTPTYSGRPRSADISKFFVKRLTPNELIYMLHLPRKGLAIGTCDYEELDYDFLFPLEPDTSIYQSWTIAGVQGKGKTSFVKLLIMALSSMEGNND